MDYKKNRFRHDSLQTKKTIHRLLNAITEGVEGGKLRFSDEDGTIEMSPSDLLELKVTASQEEGRERVNIRISWQNQHRKKGRKKPLTVSS